METDHLKEKKTNGLVNTFKSTTTIIHLKLYVRYFSSSTPTFTHAQYWYAKQFDRNLA